MLFITKQNHLTIELHNLTAMEKKDKAINYDLIFAYC